MYHSFILYTMEARGRPKGGPKILAYIYIYYSLSKELRI